MNPSTSGWINKLGHITKHHEMSFQNFGDLLDELKTIGFTYGINIRTLKNIPTEHSASESELAKINLLAALFHTHQTHTNNSNFKSFTELLLQFYKDLNLHNNSLLKKIISESSYATQLEKVIDNRVIISDNIIKKVFNNIFANSLLFIDVLIFKRYLENPKDIKKHAKHLELLAINVTYQALGTKEHNKTDEKLSQLFKASLTFTNEQEQPFNPSYRNNLKKNVNIWENQYFLELACLMIWENKSIDYQKSKFIFDLGRDLKKTPKEIKKSINEISYFFTQNAENISFLKDNNLASQFYGNMTSITNKLILRNKKRLQKELSESKELIGLLSQSTIRDLTPEEKKKAQKQLLDVFKSIPSLAIFMLPGGAILLPIFIKLIPKLLPSSFDDNRIEED